MKIQLTCKLPFYCTPPILLPDLERTLLGWVACACKPPQRVLPFSKRVTFKKIRSPSVCTFRHGELPFPDPLPVRIQVGASSLRSSAGCLGRCWNHSDTRIWKRKCQLLGTTGKPDSIIFLPANSRCARYFPPPACRIAQSFRQNAPWTSSCTTSPRHGSSQAVRSSRKSTAG